MKATENDSPLKLTQKIKHNK